MIDIVEILKGSVEMKIFYPTIEGSSEIKYPILEVNIKMIPPLINYVDSGHITYDNRIENNNDITSFVNNLNNNYNGASYYEYCDSYNEKFEIKVKNDIIKISTNNSTIILGNESKKQLIEAMNKYYDILNKYPSS